MYHEGQLATPWSTVVCLVAKAFRVVKLMFSHISKQRYQQRHIFSMDIENAARPRTGV